MSIAEARVPTKRASRYLIQLCRHADHMRALRLQPSSRRSGPMSPKVDHVDYCDTAGAIRFAEGQLSLHATADTLTLRIEATDDDALQRLQDGVAARLHKIGRRDQLTASWNRLDTPPVLPADTGHGTSPAAEPGSGKRRWRVRVGWLGLLAGGAVVVALHLGLGGAALAHAAWTGWVGNIVLVIILVKLVFIASHLIMGRYAFRRGKAVYARWKHRHSPPAHNIAVHEERP